MKNKEYYFFIFLILIFINVVLIKPQSLCQFKSDEEMIKYYIKGVIPDTKTFTDTINFKWEFIHCINGYSYSTYIIKENGEDFYENSGIFIGSSVDLGKLSPELINNMTYLDERIKDKLKAISGKFGEEAENYFNNSGGNFTLNQNDINIINENVYSYYLSEMHNYYEVNNLSYNLEMCLLTFFVKFYGLFSYLDESKNYLRLQQIYMLSYYFLYIKNSNYIQNKLWHIITLSNTTVDYNYHHISFYVDSTLRNEEHQNQIRQWMRNYISMSNNRRKLYSFGNYLGPQSNNEKKYIFNYTEFDKMIKEYEFIYNMNEDPNNGIKKMEEVLAFNASLFKERYYQRHLIIFLNSLPKRKIRTDKFIEQGINVILIFKISFRSDYQQMMTRFEDNFNFIPFYEYTDLTKDYNYTTMLNGQINFYVEPFIYNNEIIEIKGIKMIDKNNMQSFKIVYDEKPSISNYFHVSLTYNNEKEIKYLHKNNANITFFLSDHNPFSDIGDYQLINFCFNNTVSSNFTNSPYINYKIYERDNDENYFYITIFGNEIDYNLRVELLNDFDNITTTSNGLFGTLSVQPLTSELVSTFSEKCIQKLCNVDYISLVKYFTSGLHYINIDDANLFNKIFDLKMFECLYKNYFCPFYLMDERSTIYSSGPFIGYGIDLPKLTENELNKDFIPLYLINKLHPFLLNNFTREYSKETLDQYNLNLTLEELTILNLDYLSNIFQQTKGLKYFDDFPVNIQLALFLRATELGSTSGIKYLDALFKGEIDIYLQALMKSDKTHTTTFESLNFQMLLIQSTKISKLKKCLLSFVMGKSLLWSEVLLELINKFSDYRISLSYYDDESKETVLVQYFTESIAEIKDKIYSITQNSTSVDKTTNVDINSILEQQYPLFKYFDYGIKKSIIIVSTHTNGTFSYNFTDFQNEKLEQLCELGINIFDYSDRINFIEKDNNTKDKDRDDYNFYNTKKSEYIQFVPYSKYFDMSDNYITLYNIINKYPIPIKKIKSIYLDLHPNEEIIFEFNLLKEKDTKKEEEKRKILNMDNYNKLRFIFGPSNLEIYFSRIFPFPNKYTCDYNYSIDKDDENTEIIYDLKDLFSDDNNTKFYMTIKALKKIDDLFVDLEVCKDGGTCLRESFYFKFYIGFTLAGIIIFIYGIYICFCETTFKKESNIFDIK